MVPTIDRPAHANALDQRPLGALAATAAVDPG